MSVSTLSEQQGALWSSAAQSAAACNWTATWWLSYCCRWWWWWWRGWWWISRVSEQEVVQTEDRSPADGGVHTDEVIQVHLTICGGNTSQWCHVVCIIKHADIMWIKTCYRRCHVTCRTYGRIEWGGHLPWPIWILHVRSIRSKVSQEAVSRDDTELPVRAETQVHFNTGVCYLCFSGVCYLCCSGLSYLCFSGVCYLCCAGVCYLCCSGVCYLW